MSQFFVSETGVNPGQPITISGNTGSATFTNNNINLVTANTTVKFTGAADTITEDFGLTNLNLGSSLPSLAGGTNNVSLGKDVLGALTTGANNVGIGTLSLQGITIGQNNVCIGYQAGKVLTSGEGNFLLGTSSGVKLTTSSSNVGIGSFSLGNFTTGGGVAGSNVGIGSSSLTSLATGVFNLAFGTNSGNVYNGAESSNILFSSSGVNGESNTIRLGTQGTGNGQQNKAFFAGITDSTVAASAPVGVDINGQLSSLGFGTTGQVLKSTGAASSPTWQAPSSYALTMLTAGQAAVNDSTTYFMGTNATWAAGFPATAPYKLWIPKTGTLTAVVGSINFAGAASAENVTINVRLNNTTDFVVTTTSQWTSNPTTFSNTAMSGAVTAGDFISFTIATPAWATNPTTCTFNATAFIS